ncbi:MAG: mercuric transporter MerT family protein [Syntrophobacteria bacterium]
MEKTETADARKKSVWDSVGKGFVLLALAVCCVGHLFLLLILGGSIAWSGNLTALEQYRPIFVTLALVFLGLAFYKTYRKPTRASCATGDSCAVAGPKRGFKAVLWILAVVIVALLVFPSLVPHVFADSRVEQEIEAKVETRQVVLKVQNMTCSL